jgi:predicted DNA-binding transcriptional regulator YafY
MKLDRLLAITMLLLNRKRVSAKDLADRFEVTLRTVYRDMETINQAGIPIVSFAGASGGYEIMDQYRLDRQFLSLEELHSIIVALKGIRSTLDEQDIGGLLDKVGALVAKSEQSSVATLSNQLHIDINPWHGGTADKEKLDQLRAAIRNTQLIRFHYTNTNGEEDTRTCEPMSVVLKGYIWYLYGYCRLREDYRIFRLSRMQALTVMQESFERRPESLQELDVRWSRRDHHPLIRLVLRVQPGARGKIQDAFAAEDIEALDDGTMLVTSTRPEEPWLYGMLLTYGADLRVIEPQHIADILKHKAQEIVDLYK